MQAAGMLCGTGAIFLLVSLVLLIGHASALPLQFLAAIPGYIPVYIRHGDQPLEEINPLLAEAFNERRTVSKSIQQIESEHVTDHVDASLKVQSLPSDWKEQEIDNEPIERTKKKNPIYSLRTRQPEEILRDVNDDFKQEDAETRTIPKLVSIYELHSEENESVNEPDTFSSEETWLENQKATRRKPTLVSKETAIKVNEASAKEKEDFEKLQTTELLSKEKIGPNELFDPNPNYPDLPSEVSQGHNSVRGDLVFAEEPVSENGEPAVRLVNARALFGKDLIADETREVDVEVDQDKSESYDEDSKREIGESAEDYRRIKDSNVENAPIYQ